MLSVLKDFLPKEYQYHVCSYKAVNANSDHTDFEATIRMSLKSKEEILVWLKSMPVTWRVDYTRPTKGSKIIFRVGCSLDLYRAGVAATL